MSNRSLRAAYGFWAGIYDRMVADFSAPLRVRSLAALHTRPGERVLLMGVGTGLDLPLLPEGLEVVGVDLTHAMLLHARPRGDALLVEGDCQRLPFQDRSFDHVIMHLILAVVPEPAAALREAVRVLRPGGQLLVLDKFLHPGERALAKRALNRVLSPIATHTNVVFERVLGCCPELHLEADEPAALGGWFRYLRLRRAAGADALA